MSKVHGCNQKKSADSMVRHGQILTLNTLHIKNALRQRSRCMHVWKTGSASLRFTAQDRIQIRGNPIVCHTRSFHPGHRPIMRESLTQYRWSNSRGICGVGDQVGERVLLQGPRPLPTYCLSHPTMDTHSTPGECLDIRTLRVPDTHRRYGRSTYDRT